MNRFSTNYDIIHDSIKIIIDRNNNNTFFFQKITFSYMHFQLWTHFQS